MMAKRKLCVSLRLTVPDWMTPEQTKLELRSRINELCGYFDVVRGRDGAEHHLLDFDLRASRIEVRRPL